MAAPVGRSTPPGRKGSRGAERPAPGRVDLGTGATPRRATQGVELNGQGPESAIGFHAFHAKTATIGIFVILILVVLYNAGDFFAPLMAAIVVGLLLSPVSARLERRGLPPALAAALLTIAALTGVLFTLYGLVLPLSSWVERAPQLWWELREVVRALEKPLQDLESLREGARSVFGEDAKIVVKQDDGGEVRQVVTAAPVLAGQILIFIGAFYFFLAGRRELKAALVGSYRTRADQLRVARLVAATEYSVSHYLAAIASINLAFGVLVALAMTAYGLPEPLLWGLLAFALNFIPYLGPAIMTLLLFCAGLLTFHDVSTPFIVAGTYVLMNLTEGQFVTPSIIGRAATLNPFLVFTSLAFGLWFWGAIGAFLAVPMLLILRTIALHSRKAPARMRPMTHGVP